MQLCLDSEFSVCISFHFLKTLLTTIYNGLYHHQHTSGIGLSASGSRRNMSQAPGFYLKQAWGEIYKVLLLAIRSDTQAGIHWHLILWYLLCILSVLCNAFVYWLKSGVRLDSWTEWWTESIMINMSSQSKNTARKISVVRIKFWGVKILWLRDHHYVAIPDMEVWRRLARLAPDLPDGWTFPDELIPKVVSMSEVCT